jgi:hypothetical protein
MAPEVCPHCRKGKKVEATYCLPGTTEERDCSYCGRCGKNWPEKPQRDFRKAAANDDA